MTTDDTRAPRGSDLEPREHSGLSWSEYVRLAAALGLTPDQTLTPAERAAHLPAWARPELLWCDGERKLRAYGARTSPPWPTFSVTDILVQLRFHGDLALCRLTADLLATRLPLPVTAHLLRNSVWIGLGVELHGFCAAPLAQGDRPFLLGVSGARGVAHAESLVAHEAGHSWLSAEPAPGESCMTAIEQSAHMDAPIEQVPERLLAPVAAVRQQQRVDERVVRQLTKLWAFPAPEGIP